MTTNASPRIAPARTRQATKYPLHCDCGHTVLVSGMYPPRNRHMRLCPRCIEAQEPLPVVVVDGARQVDFEAQGVTQNGE